MRRSKSAQALGLMVAAATVVAMAGPPARAGIIEPELSIDGGTGVPGGTVAVTLSLADDVADVGVSAGIDLRFGAESLEFFEPVAENCAVAERISETHGVAGRLLDVDVLNIEVFVAGAPNPPPPLGNGEIVTCEFRVKDGVPAGTVALEIESPFLGDADGAQIPVRIRNGSVRIISEPPTRTPTATATPVSTNTPTASATLTRTTGATATATATVTGTSGATNTATATPTVTNTRSPVTSTATATATQTSVTPHTPTATATATRTGATPTATKKKSSGGGGCNVVPTDPAASPEAAALLLLPALLLWVRRRGH
ncbi:hypothetical protein KF840_15260 [bacterium]|nr:hypothetical protein [bacterium]